MNWKEIWNDYVRDYFYEFLKVLVVVVLCLAGIKLLLAAGAQYPVPADPNVMIRGTIARLIAMLVAVIGLTIMSFSINWSTKGNWWDELKDGNMAVGIATAGLFLAIGWAISVVV